MFSVETMRANIKIWSIVTGTAPEFLELTFPPGEKLELLYIHEDLQIASLFQFTAIYAYTRLISSLFENTAIIKGHEDDQLQKMALEYKRLIRRGGFLGLWLYICAGICRAFVTLVVSFILQFVITLENDARDDAQSSTVEWFENFETAFEGAVATTFLLLTILSVVNMVVMSKTFIVEERIGNANKKFLGIRILLICSEVVPKVIDAFEQGTPMFEQLRDVTSFLSFMYMTKEQAEILKVGILNIACLVTVIANFIFWRDLDIDKAGLLDFPDAHNKLANERNEDNLPSDAKSKLLQSEI